MKPIFRNILLALALLACAYSASAQIGKGRTFDFLNDTLTNADTVILVLNKKLEGVYNYTWQVEATNLDDTTNVTGYLEERLLDSGLWHPRDTISLSGSSTTMITGATIGFEQRFWIRSANTGVTKLNSRVWYRKE